MIKDFKSLECADTNTKCPTNISPPPKKKVLKNFLRPRAYIQDFTVFVKVLRKNNAKMFLYEITNLIFRFATSIY